MPPREVRLGAVTDVPPGGSKRFRIGARDVTVFDAQGGLRAVQDECPHRALSLCGAPVEGTTVTCPGHAWKYDLVTGECLAGDSDTRLETFPLEARDGDLWVRLP